MGKILVIDYSVVHPSLAMLKAAGVTAVGRYFGQGSPPKNLTKAEAELLGANGIDIFNLFEYGANQVLGGANQAQIDVALFKEQAKAIGVPDRPVFFAADFDIPDYAPGLPDTPENSLAKLGEAGKYWQVVRAELGDNSGGYGGYWLIKRLFDAKLITWGFQTVAWSGNQWDSRAQLRQMAITELGNEADLDVPTRRDFGQYRYGAPLPTPKPQPAGPTKAEALAAAQLLVKYLEG
jgi:hypothetical protein